MKRILSISVLGYLAYLIFTTSCANIGMPTGGDKDTIPPVVVKTVPRMEARNYKGKSVQITFDEFIQSTDVSTKLVISPPIAKRPVVKTKSKTLIIEMGEELEPNTTYSLDFKNSIVDNNEKNPMESFRFSFSNGPQFDSLMVGGYVRLADNMEPVEDALVVLHSIDSLHYFRDSIPNYIAKTDEEGFFQITNIASGLYRLYALQDADNSMTYNQPGEMIAFNDSLVLPAAPIQPDSILSDSLLVDSLNIKPSEFYDTEPYYLLMFQEDFFDQYLNDSKRDRANLIQLYFSESLSDSFSMNLIQPELENTDWALFEYTAKRDSLNLWIKDTTVSRLDTLVFQVNYLVPDSMKNLVLKTDTLQFTYEKPENKERKRKKKEDENEEEPVPHFSFKGNGKEGFDIYRKLMLEVPEPLTDFDYEKVHLVQKVDTVLEDVDFRIEQDSVNILRYRVIYPWEFEQEYGLVIDSAAAHSISGYPSNELKQRIKIKDEGFYAKIILTVTNLRGPSVIQLLKNSDKEELVQQIAMEEDGVIEFPYLNPDKFKLRLFIDRNQNGKWDTGDIDTGLQPERVVYFPKILKLRSNFEIQESWNLPDDLKFEKDIFDEDKEAEDAKAKKGKNAKSGNLR